MKEMNDVLFVFGFSVIEYVIVFIKKCFELFRFGYCSEFMIGEGFFFNVRRRFEDVNFGVNCFRGKFVVVGDDDNVNIGSVICFNGFSDFWFWGIL